MEKVTTIIEIKHFIECPHCHNSNNRIDHLFNDGKKEVCFGGWYCDDCGGGYKGSVKGKDVFVEKTDNRKDNSIVFLKSGNVLLVVKGRYYNGEHNSENDKYFYNEHTCPTNYFPDVEMVIDLENGDTDPHGIFEFVGSMPYINLEEVEDIQELLIPFSKVCDITANTKIIE